MKVDFINLYSMNHEILNKASKDKKQLAYTSMTLEQMPIGYMPHQINFGMAKYSELPEILALKSLKNIPCMYCGKKMVQNTVYDSLDYMGGTPYDYTQKAINLISSFEEILQPIEKSVFHLVKEFYEKNPNSTMQEIMQSLRPTHLTKLVEQQTKILDEISEIGNSLPEEGQAKISTIIDSAKRIIGENDPNNPFKKKEFIRSFEALRNITPDNNTFISIRQKASSMPSSGNSVDAFIVKYSGKTLDYTPKELKKLNEKLLSEPEKTILKKIILDNNFDYTKRPIQDLLDSMYTKSAKKIVKEQNWAVEELKINAKNISETILDTTQNIVNETRLMIAAKDCKPTNARQYLLKQLSELNEIINDQNLKSIQRAANKMPDSSNNMNAFIIENNAIFDYIDDIPQNCNEAKINIVNNSLILEKVKKHYTQVNGKGTWIEKARAAYPELMDNLEKTQNKGFNQINDIANSTLTIFNNDIVNLTKDFEKKSFLEQKAIINSLADLLMLEKVKKHYTQVNGKGTWIEKARAAYPELIDNLEKTQNKVLNQINDITNSMLTVFNNNIMNLTKDFEKKSVLEQKVIINRLKKLNFPLTQEGYKFLTEPISNLKTSQNNVDAFVVEYANSTIAEGLKLARRSDKEIAQRFLIESVMSVDHLKPQADDGLSTIDNLALACKHCNSEKSDTGLDVTDKNNNDFKHIQEQMDFIIDNINNGTLRNCGRYPKLIKNTLFRESNGAINIDISRLKSLNPPELTPVN